MKIRCKCGRTQDTIRCPDCGEAMKIEGQSDEKSEKALQILARASRELHDLLGQRQPIQRQPIPKGKHIKQTKELYKEFYLNFLVPKAKAHPNERQYLNPVWQEIYGKNRKIWHMEQMKEVIRKTYAKDIKRHIKSGQRKRNYIIYEPSPSSDEGKFMLRKHAKIPMDKDQQLIFMAKKNKEIETKFPYFKMLSKHMNKILPEMIKTKLFVKNGYIDYEYMSYLGMERKKDFNEFITEFLLKADKIAEYYGVENRFVVEKTKTGDLIRFRG